MAISAALQSALQGLIVQQNGLNVTGHNIANANTPGFSRQRAELVPARPDYYPFGAVGRGVEIQNIVRIVDNFLLTQMRDAFSRANGDDVLASIYDRLEVVFNELSENDLSTSANKFFDSLHDLSVNVEGEATRGLVLQQALSLRDQVNVTYTTLRDFYLQLNNDIETQVDRANELLDEIADLNVQISTSEGGGNLSANDLRDTRDQKLAKLSEIMNITVIEQPSGAVNVTTRGMPMVMYSHAFHLTTTQASGAGLPSLEVRFVDDNSLLMATEGTLPATIQGRDQILSGFMDDLDRWTSEFMFEFNRVHSQGVGSVPLTTVTSDNAVVDPNVALDQIDMGFTPWPGTFQITNGSITVAVVSSVSGEVHEYNIPVDLDGVAPADTTLNSLVAAINATVPAGTIQASVDAAGRMRVDSLDPNNFGFYFSEDTSGLLATLGIGNFWTGHDAASIDVNPALLADERLLATGKSTAPGDNTNLLDLIALRDAKVASGGSKTFEENYRSIIGRMAVESNRTSSRLAVRSDLVMRLENERESVSGVSLDEEMTKMIQFQRAYQAAARVISVSDIMLDTLINRT